MKITMYHLYPDRLNLYGDRGNILALKARCEWRGVETEICQIYQGDELDFSQADILLIGGGSTEDQQILQKSLSPQVKKLKQAVEEGLVVLAVGSGYQMLGEYYQTAAGEKIPGLGILDLYTVEGPTRFKGNVIAKLLTPPPHSTGLLTMVGFENHLGKTYLGSGLTPLGQVLRGYGNNGEDGLEGFRYKNLWGTNLHGPLLPKNPHLADELLKAVWQKKGRKAVELELNDNLEKRAHLAIVKRFGGK
ncbi:MAG: type 1 glutamine amidotransferase [Desulfitobacteriia bacterium]